ncbi:MAG: tetratricopeptide repeat protein [Pyrinomonadaceae bacterium]
MARKKRRFEQLEAAAATPDVKKIYVNPIQKQIDERLEDVGKKLEGKGRTILYGLGALVVLAILVFLFLRWSGRSSGAAQTALGKAIEISQAQISETGTPAGSTQKTYKTEKERAEAAIAAFQDVAAKYGGTAGEKAKYFVAVNKLTTDRAAGIQELEGMVSLGSETGKLAKFALAQTRVDDNKLDEAVTIYQELAAMNDPIVAKDTINFELAKIYEKQGKKQEAADIYFTIAKTASEAKDLDGKPVRMTGTATGAKDKLKQLDPERAKQIVDPTPESPFGSG